MKKIRELSLAIMAILGFAMSEAQARHHNQYLQNYCEKNGGKFISQLTCEESGRVRKEEFCHYQNADQQSLYFNGCNSDNQDGYRIYFFKACLIHDFCYHNEPRVSGKTRKDCDKEFKENMLDICKTDARNGNKHFMCKTMANAYYRAVRLGGEESWRCMKSSFRYPTNMDDLP